MPIVYLTQRNRAKVVRIQVATTIRLVRIANTPTDISRLFAAVEPIDLYNETIILTINNSGYFKRPRWSDIKVLKSSIPHDQMRWIDE